MTEKLNLGYDYGTITTLEFKTSIVEKGDGFEQRVCNWNQPLLRFDIGERDLSSSELDYFQSFLSTRKGSFEPFLIRDWSDYFVKGQLLGIGNGVVTQYQLFKSYSLADYIVNRQIFNPISYSLKVYINSRNVQGGSFPPDNFAVLLISGFSLSNSGLLTFSSAPTGIITVDFSFDVLVRFEQDRIDYRFMACDPYSGEKIFKIEKLSLVEVRNNSIIALSIPPISLTHVIELGYDYDTIGGVQHSTQITQLFSGFEVRSQNWNNVKGSWEIGNRTLNKVELDYLIILFRLCRGRFTSFVYRNYASISEILLQQVRFGEDRIGFRFDAKDLSSDEVIFYLSGIALNNLIAPSSNTFTVTSRFTVMWRDIATQGNIITNIRTGEVENILSFNPLFITTSQNWLNVPDGFSYFGFERYHDNVIAHDNVNSFSLGLSRVNNYDPPPNNLIDVTNNFSQTQGTPVEAKVTAVQIFSVVPN